MRSYKTNWKALCAAGFALSMSAGTAQADDPGTGARLTTGSGGGAYLQMSSVIGQSGSGTPVLDPTAIRFYVNGESQAPRPLTAAEYNKLLELREHINTLSQNGQVFDAAQYDALSQTDREFIRSILDSDSLAPLPAAQRSAVFAALCPPQVKPYFFKENGSVKTLAVLDRRYESLPTSAGTYSRKWNRVTPELIPKSVTVQTAVQDTRLEQVHYYSNACNLCTASGVQYGGGYRAAGLGLEGCCSSYRTGSEWIEVPYYRQETSASLVLAPIFPDFHVQSDYTTNAYAAAPANTLQTNVNFQVSNGPNGPQYGFNLDQISSQFGGTVQQSRPVDVNGIPGAGVETFTTQSGYRYDNNPEDNPQ